MNEIQYKYNSYEKERIYVKWICIHKITINKHHTYVPTYYIKQLNITVIIMYV